MAFFMLLNTKHKFKKIDGQIVIYEEPTPKRSLKLNISIHKYIFDQQSVQQLINVSIFNTETYTGNLSNNFGFYSINLLARTVDLTALLMAFNARSTSL